jgi:opacity protein-like surface antigen
MDQGGCTVKNQVRFLIAAVALFAFASSVKAAALQQPLSDDVTGRSGTQQILTPAMTGLSNYSVDSATPSLQGIIVPGTAGKTGVLYGLYLSSGGTTSDILVAIDSNPVNSGGLLGAASAGTFTTLGVNHISPVVLNTTDGVTACTTTGFCGRWEPIYPTRFNNGLVIMRKGASTAVIAYRLDSAANVTTSAP